MICINTYTSWQHLRHITKALAMFINPKFKYYQAAYNETLMGKFITGGNDIWHAIYFVDKEL